MFRTIVEMSQMLNNDERIYYTEKPEFKLPRGETFDNPHVVLRRKVLQKEIDAGLKMIDHPVDIFPTSSSVVDPEITEYLDAYEKSKNFITIFINELETTPSNALAYYIASHYYDCMSGGMPKFEMAIFYGLCLHPNIDKTTEVYPKSEDINIFSTLKDFIEEVEQNHQNIVDLYNKMNYDETLHRLNLMFEQPPVTVE